MTSEKQALEAEIKYFDDRSNNRQRRMQLAVRSAIAKTGHQNDVEKHVRSVNSEQLDETAFGNSSVVTRFDEYSIDLDDKKVTATIKTKKGSEAVFELPLNKISTESYWSVLKELSSI